MPGAKGRRRREHRLKAFTSDRDPIDEPGSNEEPAVTDGDTIYVSKVDRIWWTESRRTNGQLIDFSMGHDLQVRGKWHRALRADCAHNGPHLHTFHPRGGHHEAPLPDDIDQAYAIAEQRIWEWEETRRQYEHSRNQRKA